MRGIVYDYRQRSKLLDDEPELGFPLVRMNIEVEGETLTKQSRINYSKVVTEEHNVKGILHWEQSIRRTRDCV